MRPRAHLLLMHALDRSGRRAEAIAVYDHGRRLLADQAGLEPAVELRAAFAALLAEERETSLGPRPYAVTRAPPHGALDTARWLAREGETPAALQLALRGSWWWWLGGRRSAGRDLMADLLSTPTGVLDERQVLSASAWLAVFDAVQADAATALGRGEQALHRASALGWSQHDALAALLLAERLFQRGEHARGDGLVRAGRASFEAGDDAWGRALAAVVETKALLLRGQVRAAAAQAGRLVRDFEALGDEAGQVLALDVAGYCAEVEGDLRSAARTHERALDLARRVQAPEWETSQLTRLGSVLALTGRDGALPILESAVALAAATGSDAGLALALNGLGLASTLAGDPERAADAHRRALAWYETQRSLAGVSYTSGRLAGSSPDPDAALALATASVALAVRTGDPRAIAHGLEALALVEEDPVRSARALGGAWALRRRAEAPLPAPLREPLVRRRHELDDLLGDALPREVQQGALGAWRRSAPDQDPVSAEGHRRDRPVLGPFPRP